MTQDANDVERMEEALVEMALECWRFSRLFGKVLRKLDAGEAERYVSQFRYFQKRVEACLEANGLHFVNVEGQPFDPGLAISALNLDDFAPDEHLFVEQMLQPIVMGREGLRKQGAALLGKGKI
jgi:hypothetical protein